jgi:Rad3-related DNA helicase
MRAAAGVDLRGAVVVVDEAHNLADAIEGMHSCSAAPAAVRGGGWSYGCRRVDYFMLLSHFDVISEV